MTPAVNTVKKAKINFQIHQYKHDSSLQSYGEEASDKLNVSPDRVFKTLVVSLGGNQLVVALVPVSRQLNLKSLASAFGVKKTTLAGAKEVERSTGYVLGGVSPLGQKKKLETAIDNSALDYETIYVSAGRRGLEIELSPQDLAGLLDAVFVALAQQA